jgi:GNAT superfamily N-acetyltransferase
MRNALAQYIDPTYQSATGAYRLPGVSNRVQPSIGPVDYSLPMQALNRYAPRVFDAVLAARRRMRPAPGPNPTNFLASLLGLSDDPSGGLSLMEAPARAAAGPLGRVVRGAEEAIPGFKRPTRELASEAGYLYHATNEERAAEIAESNLRTHRAHQFTDQRAWPDGSTERRAYFSPSAGVVADFAPEEGKAVVLRVREAPGVFRRESGTGDVFTTKAIPASVLEILHEDDVWRPLKRTADPFPAARRAYQEAVARQAAKQPRANIPEAMERLESARGVRWGYEPDFPSERHSFAQTAEPNSFPPSTRGAEQRIGAYDAEGKLVGTFSQITEGEGKGAFKITVREDAQRAGWGRKLLDEAERAGLDVVGSIGENSFTHEGRSLLRNWLSSKR